MKIAIMQPYFFPYIGYFQLIRAVNKFVILDDVNYITRGWINRNRILLHGKDHLFTIPLKKASQNKKINELEICGGKDNFLLTIKHAYSKAPYYDEVFPLIKNIFDRMHDNGNLAGIAENSVRAVAGYLQLNCRFATSSEDFLLLNNLKGEKRIIAICREMGAKVYVNPAGIKGFYDKENFRSNGI
jgi:hypothetical protein